MDQQTRHVQIAATKFMFDEMIDRHAEAYLTAYPEVKEFSSFCKSGTFNYYIGTVWTNDFQKPDTQALRIRGSQTLSKNKMLELDLSSLDTSQSFFPGQIIAFMAEPHLNRQLTVKKFLDASCIAPPMKKIHTYDDVNLLVACGPYMKPESDDWILFDKIIETIKSNQVTHAVLMGPFVDLDNKQMRQQYDTNWKLIADKLVEGLHDHECHIYLVPSGRDVLPSFLRTNYFYPSAKPTIKLPVVDKSKIKCKIVPVSDPAQIDLGGLFLDVTSAEVLFHLNQCTSFINKGLSNPFTSMYRHIINQGIYPIYPPPQDMAIDYPKLEQYVRLDRLGPHIIVLPTRFSTSVVNIDDRLVVAAHKCSVKKQVVLIQIPKIESSEESPINSVVTTDYTHSIIDLLSSKGAETEMASSSEISSMISQPSTISTPPESASQEVVSV